MEGVFPAQKNYIPLMLPLEGGNVDSPFQPKPSNAKQVAECLEICFLKYDFCYCLYFLILYIYIMLRDACKSHTWCNFSPEIE